MTRNEALLLHEETLVIDAHNDSTVGHIRCGYLDLSGQTPDARPPHIRPGSIHRIRQRTPGEVAQLNIPNMHAGGIDAAYFAIDVTLAVNNHLSYAMDGIGYLIAEIAHHCDHMALARSGGDVIAAREEGRLAALLALENSDALERSFHVLQALYETGVRSITLTHSRRAWAADGCEVTGGSGLTSFGIDLIAEMNRLGMLSDVSHINDTGFWETLEQSKRPVIASHSCCRALCDNPRNLTDHQLKALADKGGVVGITFVPRFVHPQSKTLEGLLDHIAHAVNAAGIDHVGLGSDFDGGGDLMTDATGYPEITVGLAARGYGEDDLRKILGGNHLRLLTETIG